jgi:hypothetical protein
MHIVLFSWDYCNKLSQTWWLQTTENWAGGVAAQLHLLRPCIQNPNTAQKEKKKKFILSEFLNCEIQNQVVGRAVLPPKHLGEDPE